MNLFKHYYWYFIISAFFLIPGIFSLFRFGLKPAIDFTGGTLLEINFNNIENATSSANLVQQNSDSILVTDKQISQTLKDGEFIVYNVQKTGNNQFALRGKEINNKIKNQTISKLKEISGVAQELRFETVGPILGRELISKTIIAIILASFIIILYLIKQFKDVSFGVCAILAMVHDVLILLGLFSILGVLFGVEIDILFVTAVLTTLAFSVYDTVVIYDRLRELKRKESGTIKELASKAALQTMVRSLNNSLTTFFMLLSLFLLGGTTIKWFSLALLVGVISGTYSSPFTSVPLLLLWEDWKEKKKNVLK